MRFKTSTLASSSEVQLFVINQNRQNVDCNMITVLLPGWADQNGPVPLPLTEPVEVALARALDMSFASFAALPGAVCRWRGNNKNSTPSARLICADPIHIVTGVDDAQLIPGNRLNITIAETKALIEELNRHLGENQCSFTHDSAGRWYHQGLAAGSLSTPPPEAIEGKPVTLAMPRDDAARPWRALQNEVQMVLHQADVNHARQARGELSINSVWFWGAGAAPQSMQAPTTLLFSDDAYVNGLAGYLGLECRALSEWPNLASLDNTGQRVLVVDGQLLHGNPNVSDQQQLGAIWRHRLEDKLKQAPQHQAVMASCGASNDIER